MQETQKFLNARNIKCFVREHKRDAAERDATPSGFDLFVLRDEDVDEARKLLEYEYGNEWGEGVA